MILKSFQFYKGGRNLVRRETERTYVELSQHKNASIDHLQEKSI